MVSKPKGNQAQILGYYSPEAAELLRKLSETTRIPQAALLREALEDLLARYDVKPSEAYDDLRSVLTDARALANKIAAHGHKEAATVQRAGRIRQVIDSVQDRFDRTWRFGK